ncbi:sigma-70 family RNA polymerase sigma factor [Actinomadura sp. 9N215]|uniref:sigma-70 family RNA polymerase sigma factor n=1 Tax=Actinomadura sp. 9N215 TaxID=3375150 RepID=UPI00378ADF56
MERRARRDDPAEDPATAAAREPADPAEPTAAGREPTDPAEPTAAGREPADPAEPAAAEPGAAEVADAELISRVRAGDVSAYGILYERHLAAARRLARHLAGPDAADDAVQDAFTKVLKALKSGGGPDTGFRPYLLTAVRRTVYDRRRAERRVHHTDTIENFDSGVPFDDPAVEGLERSMIARAFRSLPERWQTALWHTEVEGAKPAEVASLLGLTANAAAALAYRAREGLRQAYLQMHLDDLAAEDACRPALEKLGPYVRGGLADRDSRKVRRHLKGCKRCKGIHAELVHVNKALREILGPLVLGVTTTGYLASKGGAHLWFRRLPKRQQRALGGSVIVAATVALAMMLVSGEEPIRTAPEPPVAAEPAAPPAAAPPARPPAPPRPSRPAAAREPEPPPRKAPAKKPPRRPRAQPPREYPAERPGGFLIHLKVRISRHHTTIHVQVKPGTPRGVPFRGPHGPHGSHGLHGPRGTSGYVHQKVPRHGTYSVTHRAGRHGRLKPGSRGPRG